MAKDVNIELNIPYEPQPKQRLLHEIPANEVLYGGAAGGGKSHALRWMAYLYASQISGLQVYLFRRTFPELERTHIIESEKNYPDHVMHKGQRYDICNFKVGKHRWEFVNGSVINFCHVEKANDVNKYKSEEMHLLLIDELTSFEERMYSFLRSRVRMNEEMKAKLTPEQKQRLPGIFCGTNPGDVGHAWVKKTWVDAIPPTDFDKDYSRILHTPLLPGKAYYKVKKMPLKDGGMYRAFIPALLEDNDYVDTKEYEGKLIAVGDELGDAMRYGDWDVFSGQAFPELRKHVHGIEPFDFNKFDKVYMVMDWGFAQPFSIGWYVIDFDGNIIRIYEWYGRKDPDKAQTGMMLNAADVAPKIKEIEADLGIYPKMRFGCRSMFYETGMGGQGSGTGQTIARSFGEFGIHLREGDHRRLMGKQQCHLRFAYKEDDEGNITEKPRFFVVTKYCPWFWQILPNLVLDEKKGYEDLESTRQEDHIYEELRLMFMTRPVGSKRPVKTAPRMSLAHFDKVMKKAKEHSRRWGKDYNQTFREMF